MSPTPEQQTAVERLYENEALIDNLTSDVAQPLLQLAEEQILAGADAEAVYAAVREVNQRGAQDAAAMLATVRQVLPLAGSKEADHPQAPPAEMKQEARPAESAAAPATTTVASEQKPPKPEVAPAMATNNQQPASTVAQPKTHRSFFQDWLNWFRQKRS